MKYKKFPVLVWFLSDNMQTSASMLSDKVLQRSIFGCMQCMLSARFYTIGIRSQKFYSYYFSKEHKDETLAKYFPLWPFQARPQYKNYESKEGKWCRRCHEHYDYIAQYMDVLLAEYQYRFSKDHFAAEFPKWDQFDAPKLKLPYANIKKIVLPWKTINPRYRRKDIIEGYKIQYKHYLKDKDDMKLQSYTKRDIPEFLIGNASKWME